MVKVLFDTNIFIDHFSRHMAATRELATYDDAIISSISWIEVSCTFNEEDKKDFGSFLVDSDIRVVHMDDDIMRRAGLIRGKSLHIKPKIGLPDCIIRATAEVLGRIIVTRNPRDFGGEGPQVRVPYEIDPVSLAVVNIRPPLL